jgi:hypothetical protein
MEALAFHERPDAIEHVQLEVVDVVHVADRLLQPLAPSPFQTATALDEARLQRLGMSESSLRELAASAERVRDDARKMLTP